LKKEVLITAIVFLGVGFLVGYVYNGHKHSEPAPHDAAASAQPSEDQMSGLPAGHPPINIDAMVRALEEKATQNPQASGPALQLANLLYDHQRFQAAVKWYQKALTLAPRNVDARTDLGTSYFNLGRPQEALQEYRKSLDTDPRHELTIYNMIIVNLEGTHNVAAARAAWEELHRLNPNYPGLERLKQNLDSAGARNSNARVPP
jgi:tetratricopeptide (TPR) repeat protein